LLETIKVNFNVDQIKTAQEQLVHVFNIIEEYNLPAEACGDKGIALLALTADPHFWERHMHRVAVEATFLGGQERSLEQILELIEQNSSMQNCKITIESVRKTYFDVLSAKSKVLKDKSTISEWTRGDIELWTSSQKGTILSAQERQIELVAVVRRAVEIHNKFAPRIAQLVSLLCLLDSPSNMGRLAQINTGEGKSTIVAMFAAIKALQGHKVDVVTTSVELSVPEVKKQTAFFAMLGLTVAENSNAGETVIDQYFK
jgi:preprotein translocase subunit SecA